MSKNSKPNWLILVHFEESFRHLFGEALVNVLLEARSYDRVIHMSSYIEDMDDHVWELGKVVDEAHDFSWGYEPEMFEDDEAQARFLIEAEGSAHEWTWVPWWLQDSANVDQLKRVNITLGGGYDRECLADFRAVLDHLGVEFEDDYDFIY